MMAALTLSDLVQPLCGVLVGDDVRFDAVTTDSRNLNPGDLYVALRGERFDGNDFVESAIGTGACGALVGRPMDVTGSTLEVDDTLAALGKIAQLDRANFSGPLVAITGSSGKTTVKNMLREILSQHHSVLATPGNWNNEVGVPLTLLRLEPRHDFAVIEMGAAKAGDIKYLCSLASPDVSVLLNALPAHLEGFGNVSGVATAKAEILAGLGPNGVAVINADSPYADQFKIAAGESEVISFGIDKSATVRASRVSQRGNGTVFTLTTPGGHTEIELELLGAHNVWNALAAAAAALALGIDLASTGLGLAAVSAESGRLKPFRLKNGCLLIDDSYNANPEAVKAAIDVLANTNGRRVLVLGAMGELGSESETLHAEVGRYASERDIEELWCVGPECLPA
ncbi:MAG: UDP-N-acetylmuramoyl-tripeptide--D-alanyl-D-alanine ligase, partial [Halieaceae bacterium]